MFWVLLPKESLSLYGLSLFEETAGLRSFRKLFLIACSLWKEAGVSESVSPVVSAEISEFVKEWLLIAVAASVAGVGRNGGLTLQGISVCACLGCSE